MKTEDCKYFVITQQKKEFVVKGFTTKEEAKRYNDCKNCFSTYEIYECAESAIFEAAYINIMLEKSKSKLIFCRECNRISFIKERDMEAYAFIDYKQPKRCIRCLRHKKIMPNVALQ